MRERSSRAAWAATDPLAFHEHVARRSAHAGRADVTLEVAVAAARDRRVQNQHATPSSTSSAGPSRTGSPRARSPAGNRAPRRSVAPTRKRR